MSNVIRVARTLALGREEAQLAEDAEVLRLVREQFDRTLFVVESARKLVTSERGKAMLAELEDGLGDLNHNACVHTTADAATEAEHAVGIRLVRVAQ